MNRLVVVSCIAALSLSACKKKEGEPPSAKPTAPSKPVTPPPPPPPFTGTLTIERIVGSKVALGDWTEQLALVKAQLGEPTKVDGDKYQWAVVEGDDCAYVEMRKKGDTVGMSQNPMKVAKDGPMMNRRDCLAITGVTAGPPEDPNAAGPPADGAAVSLVDFRANVIPGRSKWKDQTVKVNAVVVGVSTSTSGSDTYITVTLKADAADDQPTLGCSFPKNAAAPTVTSGPVTATGTVKIREMMSMGSGDTTLEAALEECSLTAAPAPKGKGKGK